MQRVRETAGTRTLLAEGGDGRGRSLGPRPSGLAAVPQSHGWVASALNRPPLGPRLRRPASTSESLLRPRLHQRIVASTSLAPSGCLHSDLASAVRLSPLGPRLHLDRRACRPPLRIQRLSNAAVMGRSRCLALSASALRSLPSPRQAAGSATSGATRPQRRKGREGGYAGGYVRRSPRPYARRGDRRA